MGDEENEVLIPTPGQRRKHPVRAMVGAWYVNRRADDPLRRERHKEGMAWARTGVLITVIIYLLRAQTQFQQDIKDERKAEREERSNREATLTGVLMRMDGDLVKLGIVCEQERESCWDQRLHGRKR